MNKGPEAGMGLKSLRNGKVCVNEGGREWEREDQESVTKTKPAGFVGLIRGLDLFPVS